MPAVSPSRRLLLLTGLGSLLVGALLGGAVTASVGHLYGDVRVDRTISGEVAIVNGEGSAICLTADVTGAQICSDVVQRPGDSPLAIGQHVTVTRILIHGRDAFLVTPAASVPNPT